MGHVRLFKQSSCSQAPVYLQLSGWIRFLGSYVMKKIYLLLYFECAQAQEHDFECKGDNLSSSGMERIQTQEISLTHWGWDKMTTILQMTFWNAFSWIKIVLFCVKFQLNLFPRVQLTTIQHWFGKGLGAEEATSHYDGLFHWRIYPSLGLNELRAQSPAEKHR